MGYTTDFEGVIAVDPPLNEAERKYLAGFADTRRMNRGKGPFFIGGSGFRGQGNDDADVRDHNSPDSSQPGLWCQWTPTEDGTGIEWDGGEKFYDSVEWMVYLIDTFLKPDCLVQRELAGDGIPNLGDELLEEYFGDFQFNHVCSGTIAAQGEDPDDHWRLIVENNEVRQESGQVSYGQDLGLAARAADQIAKYFYYDLEGELRKQFPPGADLCDVVHGALKEAGMVPDGFE